MLNIKIKNALLLPNLCQFVSVDEGDWDVKVDEHFLHSPQNDGDGAPAGVVALLEGHKLLHRLSDASVLNRESVRSHLRDDGRFHDHGAAGSRSPGRRVGSHADSKISIQNSQKQKDVIVTSVILTIALELWIALNICLVFL